MCFDHCPSICMIIEISMCRQLKAVDAWGPRTAHMRLVYPGHAPARDLPFSLLRRILFFFRPIQHLRGRSQMYAGGPSATRQLQGSLNAPRRGNAHMQQGGGGGGDQLWSTPWHERRRWFSRYREFANTSALRVN